MDDDASDDDDWFRHDGSSLSVGDFRRAARLANTERSDADGR